LNQLIIKILIKPSNIRNGVTEIKLKELFKMNKLENIAFSYRY